MVPPECGESFSEVRQMIFLKFSLDNHIINVCLDVSPNLIKEHCVYHSLEGSRGILKTKRHDRVTV